MNDTGGSPWPGTEQFDPLDTPTDQDFGSLLDFDNIDLDFPIDYPQSQDDSQNLNELADSLDVQHLQGQHYSPQVQHEHGDGGGAQQQQQQSNMAHSGNNLFEFSSMAPCSRASGPPFTQPHDHHMYRPHIGVPPTPNSVEMHGDPARYLQQMDVQQSMFKHRFHVRKDDASFTPLVSPAVTPHESRYSIPDFTAVPGAYFSPLTSPALNAQTQQQAQALQGQYNASSSSTGTSPADMDMEMLGEAAIAQPEQGRRLRSNRRSVPRSTQAPSRVRQSPIVKPSRRKAAVPSFIPPKEVSELVGKEQKPSSAHPSSSGLEVPRSADSSEVGSSASPEPLAEMGPPPLPGSVTHSPAISAKGNQRNTQGVHPATPASLMRLQPSPNIQLPPEGLPALDDLTLPEASLDRPSLSHIDTTIQKDEESTPRMPARKTPKLGPLSTPSAGAALSGKSSPIISAVASPISPGFATGTGKKTDSRLGRNAKKRNSVSNLVSPALRPKISPSIKPLLPEGGVTDDTHTLLLASKSNYQNILDGTTVPGVVYPTSLSTNLTSKRTSHKIAEQGRRNRINTALQEMQALLPSPQLGPRDAKSPDSSSAAQSNNSKAAKVESAIDYIKELQKQVSEKDRLIDQRDQEVEALRRELAALKRSGSVSSTQLETETKAQTETETSSSPGTENAT